MRALIIMTLLFIGFVILRYAVFDLDAPEPTPKLYDKPVALKRLQIPEKSIPQGYVPSNPAADSSCSSITKATEIKAVCPRIEQAGFPNFHEIEEFLVHVYVNENGEKASVITAQYKKKDALIGLDTKKFCEPKYSVQDHQLTWIDAASDGLAEKFCRSFRENALDQKRQRSGIEKLVVTGNAYLKFFADLLVGAFGFILALFFTKYFLIIRQVEK